ncbi:MAG: signal peptidase II [Lachnospiraceae bacterium]|nr:signal peptidase II [Lachnospiraceae bacterium]
MKIYESRRKRFVFTIVLLFLLILLDRVTKVTAQTALMNQDDYILIPGVLQLHYLENRGAAFSMLQGQRCFFFIITAVFAAVIIYFLHRCRLSKHAFPLYVTLVVLLAGALGNFYDRLFQGYVIDFIYFSLIDFPVFNVADIYVTLSVIVLIVMVLFVYKGDELDDKKESKGKD